MEKWRDVLGYEGLYQVSDKGNVKRIYNGKETIMRQRHRGKGYMGVSLLKNGHKKDFYVHRLVALMFIPNPDNLPQVNHKNLNKEDNSVENLEWCTAYENIKHKIQHSAQNKKLDHSRPRSVIYVTSGKDRKKVIQRSLTGSFIKKWECVNEIQKTLGIWHSNIIDCCKGVTKQSHGYTWSYE